MSREYREVVLSPGAEVAPGYFLVSWVGRGGFGEVRQAVGPDDRPCALKIVDLDQGYAAREARGLEYRKEVRHPHLQKSGMSSGTIRLSP